jgi:hypothetical protein
VEDYPDYLSPLVQGPGSRVQGIIDVYKIHGPRLIFEPMIPIEPFTTSKRIKDSRIKGEPLVTMERCPWRGGGAIHSAVSMKFIAE